MYLVLPIHSLTLLVMIIRDRCSLGRSWAFAVEEGAGLDFFEEFEGNNTKLKNLCDLKEVVFDLMNVNDCIKVERSSINYLFVYLSCSESFIYIYYYCTALDCAALFCLC
jgi:hypothetical protein